MLILYTEKLALINLLDSVTAQRNIDLFTTTTTTTTAAAPAATATSTTHCINKSL